MSGTAEAELKMGRPRKQPDDQPRRNDVPVRIEADVLEDIRLVATLRKISISEYLSDVMRPIAKRDADAEIARRAQSAPKKKAPPDR